ncbi:MAG: PKD domain-containing protein, partial [Bacteroidota bacterium]
MAAKRNIDILFFEELLEELSFTKGVDTYVRIHKLLENWQPTDDAEEDLKKLRVKLGSLLANSPEEQRAFYQRFDGYASRYAYVQAKEVPLPLPTTSPIWRWLFSLVVISLILAGVWLLITDSKDTFVERGLAFDSAELSKTVWFQNLAVPFSKEPFLSNRMTKYTWDFGDGSPEVETTEAIISHTYEKRDAYFVNVIAESVYGKDTTTRRIRAGLGGVMLSSQQDQENPLDWQMELSKERFREINSMGEGVSAQKILEGIAAEEQKLNEQSRYLIDGLILFGDGVQERFYLEDTAERVLFSHNYELPGRYEVDVYYSYYKIDKRTGVSEEILQDTALTTILIEGDYSYEPVGLPEISFEEINIEDLLKEQQTDWRPELLFAIAFLLYAFYEWWKWKRRKPVLDTSNDLHDPDWQPLQLDRPQVNLFRSEPFEKWALSLRRQKHTEREELDLNATLKDTLEKGGFPSLLFKPGQQTSQYLFLIECYGIHDQQAAYYRELVAELEQRDISTEVWFYHPARKKLAFYRDPQKPGENTSADGLSRLYGNYRLVIIGDGKGWDRDEARLESVNDWLEKTWISTRPPAHWDRREIELAKHFLLFPAQEEAFLSMVDVWSDVQEAKDL